MVLSFWFLIFKYNSQNKTGSKNGARLVFNSISKQFYIHYQTKKKDFVNLIFSFKKHILTITVVTPPLRSLLPPSLSPFHHCHRRRRHLTLSLSPIPPPHCCHHHSTTANNYHLNHSTIIVITTTPHLCLLIHHHTVTTTIVAVTVPPPPLLLSLLLPLLHPTTIVIPTSSF